MKVTFKKGLPGLEEYKDYELKEIEGGEEFKLLQCNEKEEFDALTGLVLMPVSVLCCVLRNRRQLQHCTAGIFLWRRGRTCCAGKQHYFPLGRSKGIFPHGELFLYGRSQ